MRVIVGMATTPKRREYATKAIESLNDDYDELFLWVNDTDIDYADNGKFWGLTQIDEDCYYFTVDDDIIYPKDYIKQTIKAIEDYKTIVTYHGRKLTGLNRNYYKNHKQYGCLLTVPEDVEVDVSGTGCTAFRTDYINVEGLHKAKDLRMADLVFGSLNLLLCILSI